MHEEVMRVTILHYGVVEVNNNHIHGGGGHCERSRMKY